MENVCSVIHRTGDALVGQDASADDGPHHGPDREHHDPAKTSVVGQIAKRT